MGWVKGSPGGESKNDSSDCKRTFRRIDLSACHIIISTVLHEVIGPRSNTMPLFC